MIIICMIQLKNSRGNEKKYYTDMSTFETHEKLCDDGTERLWRKCIKH